MIIAPINRDAKPSESQIKTDLTDYADKCRLG